MFVGDERSPVASTGRESDAARFYLLADLRRIDAQIKVLDKDIATAVDESGSHLTELYGLGPVLAARILGRVGDIQRFADEAHFASYCGVAPIEVSSGDTVRHRLSRAGDRVLNHALHIELRPSRLTGLDGCARVSSGGHYRRRQAIGAQAVVRAGWCNLVTNENAQFCPVHWSLEICAGSTVSVVAYS